MPPIRTVREVDIQMCPKLFCHGQLKELPDGNGNKFECDKCKQKWVIYRI